MRKFIGNKQFYKMVLAVAIPIMLQNGITNFVSLLDNVMVGQIGTEQMSGVAIVNQLIFVFNLCIFGGISGPGIFGAQFFGQKNHQGVRDTFRLKLMIAAIVTMLAIILFALQGDALISLFLHEGDGTADIASTLIYGKQYLFVMMFGLVPFAIVQSYSSTLRETGETVLPMKAGIIAVCVNLVFNYILIFGKLGAPALGVVGAALATVISRYVECFIVVGWTHIHQEKNVFIKGAYKSLKVPSNLVWKVITKGSPLMINEALWSAGMTSLTQCYSVRGLEVVAGLNISSTISNVFNIVFIAMGSAISIIVGQLLGAGKMEEAKDTDTKLVFFSVATTVVIGLILIVIAPIFPAMYNTEDNIKELATWFIRIAALCMPLDAFMHASYFTLRSGGKTFVTFLFDSVYLWIVSIPLAFCLTRFSILGIVPIYLICKLVDIIKCIIGFILLKKGVWLQNIVAKAE